MSKRNSPVAVQMTEHQGDSTKQNQLLNPAAPVKSRRESGTSENKTVRLNADSNQVPSKSQVKSESPVDMTAAPASTASVESDRGSTAKRPRTNRGKPPKQLSQDYHIPSQHKSRGRKKSTPSRNSRYSAAVGPLKNAPTVKTEVPSTRTDQRVTNLVPAGQASVPVAVTSSHAVVEQTHGTNYQQKLQVSPTEWYSRAVPHRTQDVPRASAPAPVSQAAKLQQQQQQQEQQRQPQQRPFPVDPSYNLCMAVECHRATAQDEDGDTPLHIALSQEEVDIRLICRLVQLIRMAGKPLDIFNDMQQTPLHIAAIIGNPTAARVLVDHGANPNETDRNGQTAMHNVCANPCSGSSATLDAILRSSSVEVDINKRNYAGFSPMHISVKNGQYELTKLLIDHRADPNCADAKSGWTPLFHAVSNQDAEHVQILLCGHAQVNMQSYSGNTALHVATGRGLTEIVRLLMRFGADMSVRNTQKDTPGMITTDNSMSNILRGVPTRCPSGASTSSPRYPSPSTHPHPTLTNGVMLLPKQSPHPQPVRPQVPVPQPTANTHIRHSSPSPRKNGERSPKGGRKENTTKTEDTSGAVSQVVPVTDKLVDRSKVQAKDTEDDASSANCRVSVIVAPKSLKRRLIERTECDEREKSPIGHSAREVEVQIKKSKAEPRSPGRPAEHINGVLDRQLLKVSLDCKRDSQSPSQLEPMDLTKRKEDVTTHLREVATSSPSSIASSFSLEDEKLRQREFAEENRASEKASSVDSSRDRVPGPEEAKVVDDHSCTPKKDKKKKKTENLPPKKRK